MVLSQYTGEERIGIRAVSTKGPSLSVFSLKIHRLLGTYSETGQEIL